MDFFSGIHSGARHALLCRASSLSLVCALAVFSSPAFANPEGAVVAAGSVSISQQGARLDVHQSSRKAVIDWRSFNIGQDEHTQFHQPDAGSITLNRIRQGSPSQIDGKLTANGRLVLVNPDGVFFNNGSSIDVAGLVATSADIADADFMSGNMQFSIPGHAGASVVNNGAITAREAGLVGFIAPYVENNGTIDARLGSVQLSSGETFVMDMAGDGIIGVAVGRDDLARQVARNTGRISADGGTVSLTAAAARSHIDSLVANTGVIEARAVSQKNGKIVLSAGGSHGTGRTGASTTVNSGTLDVSGRGDGEAGGVIQVLGDKVRLEAASRMDAAGRTGGGGIYVGGDYQGGGALQNAVQTVVARGSVADASALETGDGGRVVIWSDRDTFYEGAALARGGDLSGDGGLIEVSGKRYLDFRGAADTMAANGETGMLLLDPTDIVISNAADSGVNNATPFSPTGDDVASNLSITTLLNALTASNVTVQTRATGTQQGNITVADALALTANRTLTLDAHNDIIVDAPVTVRGTLGFTAGHDVILNADITPDAGGGSLVFQPKTLSSTVGVAGAAGTFNLGTAELDHLMPGFGTITIGAVSGTGDLNVGAYTWTSGVTFRTSGAGVLGINGTTQMAGAYDLILQADRVDLAADLIGGRSVTIQAAVNGTTMGIGDGQAGTLSLTNAELAHIVEGWSTGILLGRTTATGAMNVGAYTWNDTVTFRSTGGAININGAQDVGENSLTFSGRNINIAADLSGTGTLTFQQSSGGVSIGIGTGQAGDLSLTDATLSKIVDGWSLIAFGLTSSSAEMNIGARTWTDPVTFRSQTGTINVNGAQDMGSESLTFTGRSLNIAAPLSGSGILTIAPQGNITMGLGSGAAGEFQISDASLDQIADGWSLLQFGATNTTGAATLEVAARTWADPVRFRANTASIVILGDQFMGANDLTIESNSDPVINGDLWGSGTLRFWQRVVGTTMGIATNTATYNIDATELDHIRDGWSQIWFGNDTINVSASTTVGAYTFSHPVHFYTENGGITFDGALDMGANDLMITSRGPVNINDALSGTGTLWFYPEAPTTTISFVGGTGNLNISAASLDNISDGWAQIIYGRSDGTGTMAIGAYSGWRDNVKFMTGTGVITISGAQDYGANDVVFETNSNMGLNADIFGTGNLEIAPSAAGTTVGLAAGGAGTLALSVAELNRIQDGWNSITLGRSDSSALLTLGAYTWSDNLVLRTGTGGISITGAQDFGANDLTIRSGGDVAIGAALAGTGTLTFAGVDDATTMGLAGAAGAMTIDAASLDNISDGWSGLYFGSKTGAGAMAVGAYAGWKDNVAFISDTGLISVDGAQDFGANDFTLETNADPAINAALSGGGVLSFRPLSASTGMGFAGGAGAYSLSAAEIGRIQDGWSRIVAGRADLAAQLDIGASTWNDPVHFLSAGDILLNGVLASTEAAGTSLVLASTAGNFVNTAGASALDPGGGRYLVYSASPASDTLDGLSGYGKVYNKTYAGYGPDAVAQAGNMHFYSIAPTLTVTADDISREYGLGQSLTATITGFIDGDTAADAVTGVAGLSTTAGLGSDVGSYAITAAIGSLASSMGYQFTNFADGVLTVTPATLTVTANDKTREYGLANPALDGVITGYRNGDTEAVVSGLSYNTAATVASGVGSYAITGAGATAANYTFSYVNGNLEITKAPLIVTADNKQKQQGQPNPAFTAQVTGLRNGDAAGVLGGLDFTTPATASSAPGSYAITPFGAVAANYQVTSYVDGVLDVVAASGIQGGIPPVVEAVFTPAYQAALFAPALAPVTAQDAAQDSIIVPGGLFVHETAGEANPRKGRSAVPQGATGQDDEGEGEDTRNRDARYIKGGRIRGVFIQAGLFSNKEDALKLAKAIAGMEKAFIQETSAGNAPAWRVGLGPFAGRREAGKQLSMLHGSLGPGAILVAPSSQPGNR